MDNTTESAITTQGIHHLGLTVVDIHATADFFIGELGFKKLGDDPSRQVIFISDNHTMLTIWQIQNAEDFVSFDRKNNIGLHHFAIKVANTDVLQAAYKRFTTLGIDIEFAPESMDGTALKHMIFNLPNGPRIELVA